MDDHIRWLRRLLISRVIRRLALEGTVAGLAVFCAAFIAELAPVAGAVLAVAAAQTLAVARIGTAVLLNPVNHRYLMAWDDPSRRLTRTEVGSERDPAIDSTLDRNGFHHLVDLVGPDDEHRLYVYSTVARLIVVSVGEQDEPYVAVSRLSDQRLLVSAADVIPPLSGIILNQCNGAALSKLVESHQERLRSLEDDGHDVLEVDHGAVVEQLHFEWKAWNELGPFIGPFLAVGTQTRPLTMQARIDTEALWERTRVPLAGLEPDQSGRRSRASSLGTTT